MGRSASGMPGPVSVTASSASPAAAAASSVTAPPVGVWCRALSTSAPSICRTRSRIGPHEERSGGEARLETDTREIGSRAEVPDDGRQQLKGIDVSKDERHPARLGETHGAQVVDHPREQVRLLADGQQMRVVVLVDTIEDCGRGGIDDRERCLELVCRVLEEATTRLVRALQCRGHAVERAAQVADLVATAGHAGAPLEVARGNVGGGGTQTTERADQPAGDQEPEEGRTGSGHDRHQHDGHGGLLLSPTRAPTLPRTRAQPLPLPTSRACVVGLRLGLCLPEAPIHDARRDDGDGPGGDDRDEPEDECQPDAQAHRRAPR